MVYMAIRRLLERTGIHKSQTGPHQVMENMRHINITTTSRYLHLVGPVK